MSLAGGRTPNFHMDFPKPELSPAAQTLKHMAEQHQHKNNQYNRGPYGADFGNYQQQNPGQQVRNLKAENGINYLSIDNELILNF